MIRCEHTQYTLDIGHMWCGRVNDSANSLYIQTLNKIVTENTSVDLSELSFRKPESSTETLSNLLFTDNFKAVSSSSFSLYINLKK